MAQTLGTKEQHAEWDLSLSTRRKGSHAAQWARLCDDTCCIGARALTPPAGRHVAHTLNATQGVSTGML